jgi:hypothetical protein
MVNGPLTAIAAPTIFSVGPRPTRPAAIVDGVSDPSARFNQPGRRKAMSAADQARLLLAIVRRDWDEAVACARRTPADPVAFPALCREADVHPWVHDLLVRSDRTSLVRPEILADLESRRTKVSHDNLLLLARAEQALDLLLAEGVTPVALKGLDLIHRLYDRFDQRTIDDVDLLVRRDELGATLEALRRAGWRVPDPDRWTHYVRSSHHLPIDSPGPVPVAFEIHWSLAQSGRYAVDPEALIARAEPLEISGRCARRLEDHDLVAHLLIHHLSHYFDRRLKWLVDLQRITMQPGFLWSRVFERIREWDARAAAAVSLLHLHRLDPNCIPERVLRGLPLARWRRALTAPLRSSHPLELFRGTRSRAGQLYVAAVMLERPWRLPGWLLHRLVRDRRTADHPLDPAR